MTSRLLSLLTLATAVATAGCESSTVPSDPAPPSNALARQATVSVFATGLEFPRGLTFGPGGILYVAEAGTGGTAATTPEQCAQVIPPTGPYFNGPTGRISAIDRHGNRSTFAEGFPSGINGFGDVQGIADVAFVGHNLYALVAGGGCSHGSAHVPAGIARVSRSGTWAMTADLSAWQAANRSTHARTPPTSSRMAPGIR